METFIDVYWSGDRISLILQCTNVPESTCKSNYILCSNKWKKLYATSIFSNTITSYN